MIRIAEDGLREQHGLDVRILDRTWILDRVFQNGREALAIEDLRLVITKRKDVQKGPLDTQRELDLKETEERIQLAIQEGALSAQLAEDCIDSADLARQLERPRPDVEGLYDRAEQVSAKYGNEHQRLRCAYQRAWTAFWWHEDYQRFSELYTTVQQRAEGSRRTSDIELLSNLWSILYGSVIRQRLDKELSDLPARTAFLQKELNRLCSLEEQPSAVLHARTLRLQMQLTLSVAAKEPLEPILQEFRQVVSSCDGLAGFPLAPLIKTLTELGEFLGSLAAYDELFQAIVAVQSCREGDIASALLLLRRGIQQLNADRPYDAIRTLGLSLRKLYKHESRHDAVRALYSCACAYERVGLLWAARGTVLSAASLAAADFWQYGDVTRAQALCYRRLKWLELQLGRIPQALSWHEVDTATRGALAGKGAEIKQLLNGEVAFDATLGILLLKTDYWELKRVSALPGALDALGLFNASVALTYALGYEEELRGTFFREIGLEEDVFTYFLKWRDHQAARDLPETPSLYEERRVTLKSYLLGCEITLETENSSPCVELAESILAALESLLSTATGDWLAVREPVMTISVRRSDFAKQPFEFELLDHVGRPHVDIICAVFDSHSISTTKQQESKDKLFEMLSAVLARLVVTNDAPRALERLFRDELALDRSVNFTGSFVVVANVLGHNPKSQISSWSIPATLSHSRPASRH